MVLSPDDDANVRTLTTQADGAIADRVYTRNQHGTYSRARVVPVQPNNARQVAARAAFAGISQRWSSLLSDAQRDTWATYARAKAHPTKSRTRTTPTARGLYLASNVPRQLFGYPLVDDAPAVFAPVMFWGMRVSLVVALKLLRTRVTWDTGNPWYASADNWLQVQTTPLVPPTHGYIRGPWSTDGTLPGLIPPPWEVDRVDLPAFKDPRRAARARVYMADGRVSAWQYAYTFKGPKGA